jgi:hypothetical protein
VKVVHPPCPGRRPRARPARATADGQLGRLTAGASSRVFQLAREDGRRRSGVTNSAYTSGIWLTVFAQEVRIPLFPHLFSEEMTCCRSKYDFLKKSRGLLFSAKVQNHPGSSEIGRNLHKIQKIPPKATAAKRELICVSQMVYYFCGVFSPAFDFAFR